MSRQRRPWGKTKEFAGSTHTTYMFEFPFCFFRDFEWSIFFSRSPIEFGGQGKEKTSYTPTRASLYVERQQLQGTPSKSIRRTR
jgi:hypothetical protein